MIVRADFETRSDVDLRKCGAHEYFNSPHADVLICAYQIDTGPVKAWIRGEPRPDDLCAAIAAGAEIHAWNAAFEYLGFKLLADRYGWPRARLEQFHDTAAAASAMSLPRALGDAAAALGTSVQKDKEGARLIRKFSIPRRARKGEDPNGIYWNEPEGHPDDFALFVDYAKTDVATEAAIAARLGPLSDAEQAVYTLTERINILGVRIDRRSAEAALRLAEKAKKALDRDMRVVTGGYVTACTQVAKLTEWIQNYGVPLDSLGKAEITDLLELDDLPDAVRRALEIRQEAAKTSVSKLKAMLASR